MQKLTDGNHNVEVEGETVRQVVDALETRYPGFKGRIVENDRIKTEIAVAIDGEVVTAGLRAKVGPDSEVHFLPALAGG
mgnify:FL=1